MSTPEVSLAPDWDPQHPPTRIYVQGYTYRIVAPSIIHPPLVNTVKAILNWSGPAARLAKNIFYLLFPTGVDTTVTTFLQDVANQIMTSWASSTLMNNIGPQWFLNSATVKDNGGTSESQATSTHLAIQGSSTYPAYPPQVAVVLSWPISASYRGGKPRWYLPGLMTQSSTTQGAPDIQPSIAANIQSAAAGFRISLNSAVIDTFSPVLGTISYSSGHAARPTPLFRAFGVPKVHERLDSQRRRSGKESSFGSVP